jgi:hypothetical protein
MINEIERLTTAQPTNLPFHLNPKSCGQSSRETLEMCLPTAKNN